MNAADVVDDTGDSDGIVRPAAVLAIDRDAARCRPVDVRKVPRLDVAVGPASAGEPRAARPGRTPLRVFN